MGNDPKTVTAGPVTATVATEIMVLVTVFPVSIKIIRDIATHSVVYAKDGLIFAARIVVGVALLPVSENKIVAGSTICVASAKLGMGGGGLIVVRACSHKAFSGGRMLPPITVTTRRCAMKVRSMMALAVVLVILAPVAVAAQEPVNPQITDMTAQQKAEMEAMMKAAALGKQHQWLATLAGKWDFIARVYMNPGAPPMESKGSAERTLMLGGRVLAETVHGNVMGAPFEGHGMSGYDNVTGKFWGTWMDNMSTGPMVSWGTCDDQGSCTFSGQFSDPMTGQLKTSKMVSKHMGDTEHHEFWETRDGKEVKTFELEYKRQK